MLAVSESCAASAPVLTIAPCTVAVPSTAVCTWVQAEKSPDSKPSLNTVSTTRLGLDVAVPEPNALLAVTATRRVLPTSSPPAT